MKSPRAQRNWGLCPRPPGFTACFRQNGNVWFDPGAADAAPAFPAAESTLGSHPCIALSSAQVFPEWTTSTSPCNDLSANGDNPLNFVSHSRGSLHSADTPLVHPPSGVTPESIV